MNPIIDFSSPRYSEAKLSKKIGRSGYTALVVVGTASVVGAAVIEITKHGPLIAAVLCSIALACYLPAIWWKNQLSILPATGTSPTERLSVHVLLLLDKRMELNPKTMWAAISNNWQAHFFTNHLLLNGELVQAQLSTDAAVLQQALGIATKIADEQGADTIELGFVVAGLLMSAPKIAQIIVQNQGQPEDIKEIANWLGRNLHASSSAKRSFGGIGRDWAFGFTPLLDRLGNNISLDIGGHGEHFDWLASSEGVQAIEKAFENQASAIALIGPTGIGKTNNVYALAQRMIEGNTVPSLAYHQIIELNATDITSRAHSPGDLEQIMVSLVNEASRAGHIILFFDDAQSFFSTGPGAFDASQILLTIIEAMAVPIILAMQPRDYQGLKSQNQTLAGLLTLVVLQELPEADVMRVLEDTTAGLEYQYHALITYEALHEVYRLSGRYEQDEAYPGKAIKLLQQAINHADDNKLVSRQSVQQAIEQTRGIKVGTAKPVEADILLHLEEMIHGRMINQAHAVNVVASSLRRARAGVTNPSRPIGSFLFLGPTGVGKTELAKSIAAIYFGSEENMIRLDMSEYQQPDDVQRLLSTGVSENASLLMQVREHPFAVVLLDEVEKAHPNILNLLLQMLDEGQLTDASGRAASFKDCVIIATSNAGADTIRRRIEQGENLEGFTAAFSDELIESGQFKPELLNRFDEMVLFRPLSPDELGQVVSLMLAEVNQTLTNQNISVELTPAAIQKIVQVGNDPRLGARPMRRTLQRAVEDTIAEMILKQEVKPGDHVIIDEPNLKI